MHFAIVNGLTLSRICAALLIAAFFWPHEAWMVTFVLMIAAFATDLVDGWLARRWRVVSTFGKITDPLADKAICLVILWLIAGYYGDLIYIVIASIFTVYDVTTMSFRIFTKKSSRPIAAASIIAKIKTAVLMLGLTFAMLGVAVSPDGLLAGFGLVLLSIASVLSMRSLLHYVRQLLAARQQKPEAKI